MAHAQSEAKVVATERGSKREGGGGAMSGRSQGRRRMHTIDEAELNHKERQLKQSIEVMQGALSQIQSQKSQRRALKVIRQEQLT